MSELTASADPGMVGEAGKYVYCIIRDDRNRDFGEIGIGGGGRGGRPTPPLPRAGRGGGGARPTTLEQAHE